MKRQKWTIGICAALTAGMALSLMGCSKSNDIIVKSADLMEGIQQNKVHTDVDITGNGAEVLTDFGVRLLQNTINGEQNTLISPFSVICALGMTANGAQGRTLEQMEQVFGIGTEELNAYLYAYVNGLSNGKNYKLSVANSIWFKDDKNFTVKQNFLQTNADWYGADIYKQIFNDEATEKINHWVKEHTDGMIPEILSEVPKDAVMYLVNALAFDAEWERIYKESEVHDRVFTTEDKKEQKVEMMYSMEHKYLEDENATGFIKYYAGKKYAFAALLPKEGISIEDYIKSLNGENLHTILENATEIDVNAAIPKFQCEYDIELSKVFEGLGMTDAFDSDLADFSEIGSYTNQNLYISRILHKTFLAVDEKGTKAGAATAVEMARGLSLREEKQVHLNRPFVYLLMDCKANVPVFIGTVMEIEEN